VSLVSVLATVVFAGAGSAGGPRSKTAVGSASVIVRARPGHAASVERGLNQLGGRVQFRLGIINGFSATLPKRNVSALRHFGTVLSVTPNAVMHPFSYSATSDVGSMLNVSQMTGAQLYWQAGYTGAGVDVALIDSGVAPVDGLTTPGKVINGPDLSLESQNSNLRYLDTLGHGTHMAGIIAGRANAAVPGNYVGDQTNFLGMAPDARIVSLKIADAFGNTDVSQVIAALDWVVQHRFDNGMNIRVINVSYGTNASQDYKLDPLSYAAEIAWKKGIVVVTAAGNAGFVRGGSLTNPAIDPYLIAVGAADTNGTPTYSDDTLASFSSTGTLARRIDLLAPGTHIVSLRDPGSFIDQTYGSTGQVTNDLFRGSGTSQAAAIVSGAAALLLQQHPELTPDQVKRMLKAGADPLTDVRLAFQGGGELNLANDFDRRIPGFAQSHVQSVGTGSLELSRGDIHLSLNGVTLSGEQDIFGAPFQSAQTAALEASGNSWSGGVWNGNSWSGNSWSGNSWSGNSWSGNSWSGNSWSGNSWSGNSWSGNSWSGNSWSGNSWSGNSWSGNSWSGNSWSGNSWSSSAWLGNTWLGNTWHGNTWHGNTWG
jgi:serine protease AprX